MHNVRPYVYSRPWLNLLYPNTVDNESFESLSARQPEFFNDKEISFYPFEKKV